MDYDNLMQKLEAIVAVRTPQYVSLSRPRFDEKLLKAHALLARLYAAEGERAEAHDHFRAAEQEFLTMCRVKTQEPQYFAGGREGFKRLREQERATERQLARYQAMLVGIANEVGHDATQLFAAPTRV
jgi:xylose isomerase